MHNHLTKEAFVEPCHHDTGLRLSVHVQYQQPMGMAQNVSRRPMRPKKKAGQHVANPDDVRRTIYICDIASKVRRATAHCRALYLCPWPARKPSCLPGSACTGVTTHGLGLQPLYSGAWPACSPPCLAEFVMHVQA